MRYHCRCLVIHAPTDLRLDEQDAGEVGPGQMLVRVGFGGICGSDLHYFHHGGFGTVRISSRWCWATRWPAAWRRWPMTSRRWVWATGWPSTPAGWLATITLAAARAGSGACASGVGGQVEYRV